MDDDVMKAVDKITKTPRLPKVINLELRKKYKRMNDYSAGVGKKRDGAEKLAMEIQLLQFELKGSMAFHITEVPPTEKPQVIAKVPSIGKLQLIKQFP